VIGQLRVLGVIPARGGSKGLPRKNLLPAKGRALLNWTVDVAKKSKYLDRLIVSTDDIEIANVAKSGGAEVPFLRPNELSGDHANSFDVVEHAINALEESYDIVVLLQPTSPLRLVDDIDICIDKCAANSSSCVSVVESEKTPYWMYFLSEDSELIPVMDQNTSLTRRQDAEKVYSLNGAVYACNVNFLIKNKVFFNSDSTAHVMPPERSIDIDTHLDFEIFKVIADQLN